MADIPGFRLGDRPFTIDFDLQSGYAKDRGPTQRRLASMQGVFSDAEAYQVALAQGDPLIYEYYELDMPAQPADLGFGTSIVYPGRIGREYYMTKGHFHAELETAEVYYCLAGRGIMLLENAEGIWAAEVMIPGTVVYVPKRFAHRSINTGEGRLVTFFTLRADAGHDYGTIARTGFRKLVVDDGGKPVVIDNPRWSETQ